MTSARRLYLLLTLLLFTLTLGAQNLTGRITDAETGEEIPYASVVYHGHRVAVISDIDGNYSIAKHLGWKLSFSAVGYQTIEVTINNQTKNKMDIALKSDSKQLKEVTISSKKGKYSRKNNPAVELMKKVIAAKKVTDLGNHDYYKYDKYEKLTLAANDLTPQKLEKKPFSSTPWLSGRGMSVQQEDDPAHQYRRDRLTDRLSERPEVEEDVYQRSAVVGYQRPVPDR